MFDGDTYIGGYSTRHYSMNITATRLSLSRRLPSRDGLDLLLGIGGSTCPRIPESKGEKSPVPYIGEKRPPNFGHRLLRDVSFSKAHLLSIASS